MKETLQSLLQRAETAKAIGDEIGRLDAFTDDMQRKVVEVRIHNLPNARVSSCPNEPSIFKALEIGRQTLLGQLHKQLESVLKTPSAVIESKTKCDVCGGTGLGTDEVNDQCNKCFGDGVV